VAFIKMVSGTKTLAADPSSSVERWSCWGLIVLV